MPSSGDTETEKPQRPMRGVQKTQKQVDSSQKAVEVEAARLKPQRKPGEKALAAAEVMTQLLDGYIPPPSSAVLLYK
jgi:hypothetical protein